MDRAQAATSCTDYLEWARKANRIAVENADQCPLYSTRPPLAIARKVKNMRKASPSLNEFYDG